MDYLVWLCTYMYINFLNWGQLSIENAKNMRGICSDNPLVKHVHIEDVIE